MKTFMVEIRLPYEPTQEFFSLIPAQRAMVIDLLMKRKFLSYTLAADRSKVWIVMVAESEADARVLLEKQPMDKYFGYLFTELMFHDMAGALFPSVSLN
ncbi:MAG: hypothetical protein WCX28_00550 [Bacteriovoracaceae bacterium]|nr:hypothetical protein [Bacteroidota bacterium]